MALTKVQLVDLNSNELILDLDADTSLHSSTDDQIDIKIGGADDFKFTANTFTALAGSSIVVPDSGLTLGSTAVTSTAAELNLLDGVSGLVQADLTKLAALDATAAEINLIDGGTSTGTTAVADADGIITNDGGTMRLTTAATFKTYFQEGISQAYDDFTIGDAAVLITTSSGNITIDAAANDSDIIFKGTDGGADTTFLTIDGSAAGAATFNNIITAVGTSVFTNLDISGDVDIDGTTNLDIVDIDGAVNIAADVTVASTNKIIFNDASQFIQGASATVLDIAATDEIELTATLIDVVGNLAVSGTLAQADALTMATNKKIIFRDAAIHISSTADGDLSIAADDEIDITSTLIDINGNVEISGTAVTTGVHTFTAVPVFPNDTIETADIQADAIDGS